MGIGYRLRYACGARGMSWNGQRRLRARRSDTDTMNKGSSKAEANVLRYGYRG